MHGRGVENTAVTWVAQDTKQSMAERYSSERGFILHHFDKAFRAVAYYHVHADM